MEATRTRRHWRAALLAAPLALAAAACSSTSSTQTAGGGAPQTAAPVTTAAPAPCDTSVNPVSFYEDAQLAGTLAAGGHDHHGGGDGHAHGGDDHATMDHGSMGHTSGSDKPMDMSGGLGEVEAAKFMIEMAQMSDEEYDKWLESLNPNRAEGAPDDTGMGGHLGPQTWTHLSDPKLCDQLRSELETAKTVAMKYPKASDAMAAGYVRVAPYLSGIASHWMNFKYVDSKFNVSEPEMLLYDGNGAESNLVGLSYFVRSDGGVEPKEGFVGDNDHYHRHEGLCVSTSGVIGDSTTSEEECKAMGGRKQKGADGWMSHAWVVPGCESPWGVFSAQNPVLDMPLVDQSGVGAPCSGSQVKARWDLTPAKPS